MPNKVNYNKQSQTLVKNHTIDLFVKAPANFIMSEYTITSIFFLFKMKIRFSVLNFRNVKGFKGKMDFKTIHFY